MTAWLASFALLAGLIWLGVRAWRSRSPEPTSEAQQMLRLWLEDWMLVDDIVQCAFEHKTATPQGINAVRMSLGVMNEPETRAAVAAFLQHRNVRKQVAKYMHWRYQLPKSECIAKLNELSELARA